MKPIGPSGVCRTARNLYIKKKDQRNLIFFLGSRGRIRTDDQLVTLTPILLSGVDYLIAIIRMNLRRWALWGVLT